MLDPKKLDAKYQPDDASRFRAIGRNHKFINNINLIICFPASTRAFATARRPKGPEEGIIAPGIVEYITAYHNNILGEQNERHLLESCSKTADTRFADVFWIAI